MSMITEFNSSYDFWDMHPGLDKVEEFKYVKKNYKNSSNVMWFIAHLQSLDSRNKFKGLEFDERARILSKDMVGDKDFWNKNQDKLQAAIEKFILFDDTAAKRQLRQLEETLEKRRIFLRDADYSMDNFEKLDKMAANTAAIFKMYAEVEKLFSKEEGTGSTKGGHIPSLLDQDEI